MIPFSVQKAVEITGGQFCGPEALLSDSFDSVSIDTRTTAASFVARKRC